MTALTLLDEMLRVVLEDGVTSLGSPVGASQITFEPPESGGGNQARLCVYLVEVRENVKLRSSETEQITLKGVVKNRKAPYRLDCHYLISAFAGVQAGQPPLQHDLLYEATEALVRSQPLVPARVLAGHAKLADWPPEQRDLELPLTINPPEGFPKLAEFWGTMPKQHPWRPVVHLVVTIPVDYAATTPPATVQHAITVYGAGADASGAGSGPTEPRARIGGAVIDADRKPVGRARVFALDGAGRLLARTICDEDGRFIIDLPGPAAQIYAAAFGYGTTPPLVLPVTLPASGVAPEYTLQFP